MERSSGDNRFATMEAISQMLPTKVKEPIYWTVWTPATSSGRPRRLPTADSRLLVEDLARGAHTLNLVADRAGSGTMDYDVNDAVMAAKHLGHECV